MPDPQDPATRERSCLDWSEPGREPHARVLAWYRELIALRRTHPDLASTDLTAVRVTYDRTAQWLMVRRGDLRIVVNVSERPAVIGLGPRPARAVAAWEPVSGPGTDGLLTVPAESCAVLVQP